MSQPSIQLSVVVRIVGGPEHLVRCLEHLLPQTTGRPVEVLVPYDESVAGILECRQRFPSVRFLDMGRIPVTAGAHGAVHERIDRRTARGLSEAAGQIVALLEDYGAPAAGWFEQVIEAHRLPHGAIGGAVEHVGTGPWNWALYFQDFGRYQPPLAEGPSPYLTDINVSYKREALESVRPLWSERFSELTVHNALSRKGFTLWLHPRIVVLHSRGPVSARSLIVERFYWGRLFAAVRTREISFFFRLLYIAGSPVIPFLLLGRMARKTLAGGRNSIPFLLSFPCYCLLAASWSAGELAGYLTGREL